MTILYLLLLKLMTTKTTLIFKINQHRSDFFLVVTISLSWIIFFQISFPDLGSHSDIVKLRGPKDDVDKCTRAINKIYKDLLESNYQVKVPIFKQFHKYIIGKGGATIRKIRQETDTRYNFSFKRDNISLKL